MTDFQTLAHERYSCRRFSERPVEEEKIEAILGAAACAPSAVNRQPWHAWLLTSPKDAQKFAGMTRYSFGAKTFLVFGAKAEEAWNRRYDGRNFADVDAAIAATHAMLAIQDLGLGTTWVASFDAPAMREAFPQMEGYDLVCVLPIGYPADDAKPAPKHTERKPLDELFTRL